MKRFLPIILLVATTHLSRAEDEKLDREAMLEKHSEGSERLANEQDELSGDVQQLVMEQTVPQVIQLLSEVGEIMVETTDYLAEPDTGGRTIAAQTEIIEKIHQAAKAKQQQSGAGEPGSAMMDMMERMMGKKPGEGEGKEKGKGKGKGEGEQGGDGQTGESDEANTANGGNATGQSEERRIPKAAGKTGKGLPDEFQDVLEAYNRGLEDLSK